ncbi:MAG: epimerase [Sphingobacteriales bacterium]|nr:MAG: epimerase [Sphingobacteriales bacterium]
MQKSTNQKLNIILTGATGMVGEGVLQECLHHENVENVLIINRKPGNIKHPKLKEILHANFFDLSNIEKHLSGYNTCFFCLGVSSVGMPEDKYYHLTYNLTLNFAETVSRLNNDMTFCYISGSGTDSTEKGRSMWARVKGKTENALTELPFNQVYNFRPGGLIASKGQKNTPKIYKYIGWLLPVIRTVAPNFVSTLQELGLAMINASTKGYNKQIIEVADIKALAKL